MDRLITKWGFINLLMAEGFVANQVTYRGEVTGDTLWQKQGIGDVSFFIKKFSSVDTGHYHALANALGETTKIVVSKSVVANAVKLAGLAYEYHVSKTEVSDKTNLVYDLLEWSIKPNKLIEYLSNFSGDPVELVEDIVTTIVTDFGPESFSTENELAIEKDHFKHLYRGETYEISRIIFSKRDEINIHEISDDEIMVMVHESVNSVMLDFLMHVTESTEDMLISDVRTSLQHNISALRAI